MDHGAAMIAPGAPMTPDTSVFVVDVALNGA